MVPINIPMGRLQAGRVSGDAIRPVRGRRYPAISHNRGRGQGGYLFGFMNCLFYSG